MNLQDELNALVGTTSWDEVYECDLVKLSKEEEALLCRSYYGLPLTEENVQRFLQGFDADNDKYAVVSTDVDGKNYCGFESLDEARDYAKKMAGQDVVLDGPSSISTFGTVVNLKSL